MQQFLVTGHALYVVAAVCGLGVLCKWVTRILYKRLIKEAGNLAMTKNRNLKMLRQRVENTYRTNAGVGNMSAYLERQMYDFKFLGFTLNRWADFSNQMTFLCFLTGGIAAFLSYWYRSDSYYIVLYGSMGILAGVFILMVDSGVNLNEKREQLLIALEDYMDNSLFFRPGKGRMASETEGEENGEPETVVAARSAAARRSSKRREREAVVRGTAAEVRSAAAEGKRSLREKIRDRRAEGEREQADAREFQTDMRQTGDGQAGEAAVPYENSQRTDYLKHSLEQIAASRERHKDKDETLPEENWLKDLNPQEMKILGDIIKEYLI